MERSERGLTPEVRDIMRGLVLPVERSVRDARQQMSDRTTWPHPRLDGPIEHQSRADCRVSERDAAPREQSGGGRSNLERRCITWEGGARGNQDSRQESQGTD